MVTARIRSVTVLMAGQVHCVINFAVTIVVTVSMASVTMGHASARKDGMASIVHLVSHYITFFPSLLKK